MKHRPSPFGDDRFDVLRLRETVIDDRSEVLASVRDEALEPAEEQVAHVGPDDLRRLVHHLEANLEAQLADLTLRDDEVGVGVGGRVERD